MDDFNTQDSSDFGGSFSPSPFDPARDNSFTKNPKNKTDEPKNIKTEPEDDWLITFPWACFF